LLISVVYAECHFQPFMLIVSILNAIMIIVVMLIVVAPFFNNIEVGFLILFTFLCSKKT
jgi:hypothetical protein